MGNEQIHAERSAAYTKLGLSVACQLEKKNMTKPSRKAGDLLRKGF